MSDFLSKHVDWKKVITTGLMGAAALFVGNIGLNKVNEYATTEIQRRLDRQGEFFRTELDKLRVQIDKVRIEEREHDKDILDSVHREQDLIHQEIREDRNGRKQ